MEAGAKPDDGDAASAQPPGGGSQADTSHVDDIMSGKYDEAEAEGDDPGEDIRKMHQVLSRAAFCK
jgi:hypothetical protein